MRLAQEEGRARRRDDGAPLPPRNIRVINSMIVRIMTCMWLPCECAPTNAPNSQPVNEGNGEFSRRDVFVSTTSNTRRAPSIFGTVTDDRLNVSAINLSFPQRLHFKLSVWAAFACNVSFRMLQLKRRCWRNIKTELLSADSRSDRVVRSESLQPVISHYAEGIFITTLAEL